MKIPQKIADAATLRAKELRKNITEAEQTLWELIRGRKLCKAKFYRQRPIYYQVNDQIHFYIADFCCDELKLVIEVDGGYHNDTQEQDQLRDQILAGLGYHTFRLTNEQILNDIDSSIKIIEQTIKSLKIKT